MRHLYNKAAQREPEMMRRARRARADQKAAEGGQDGVFEITEQPSKADDTLGQVLWRPEPTWDPASRDWWYPD